MRLKGTLVEWNDDRGFGFLEPAGGGDRAFCHISAFANRSRRPMVGQRVTYETSRDERGRLRATQIRPVTASRPAMNEPPSKTTSPGVAIIGSAIFLIVITSLVFAGRLPWF